MGNERSRLTNSDFLHLKIVFESKTDTNYVLVDCKKYFDLSTVMYNVSRASMVSDIVFQIFLSILFFILVERQWKYRFNTE